MSGLLHRLAARANGSAWSMRSDARLPFAAAGLEPAPTLAAQAPQTDPAPMLQPAVPGPARPAQAAAVQAAVPSTPMPPSRLQQAPWQAPANAPSAATPSKAAPLRRSAEPVANDVQPPQPSPGPPSTQAMRTQQEGAAPQAKPLAPAFTPQQQQRDPAPLLPPRTAAASSAMPAGPAAYTRAASWSASMQPAAREDSEVHIHIGRIDITAVHEAPKPRPRTRERAQPVSLHDYLATRTTP